MGSVAKSRTRRLPSPMEIRGRSRGPLARPRAPTPHNRPVLRAAARYRRVGKLQVVRGGNFIFEVQTLENKRTGRKEVLVQRYDRQTSERDWRIMSVTEYNTRMTRRTGKDNQKVQILTASASMLARNPEVFTTLGKDVGKNLIDILMSI